MQKYLTKIMSALFFGLGLTVGSSLLASETDLVLPEFNTPFQLFGSTLTGREILLWGMGIVFLGLIFGFREFRKIRSLPAHKSMLDVSALIYETCKTYLLQQGKLLIGLEVFIGACIVYYFFGLKE